jgi:hypothetical protein
VLLQTRNVGEVLRTIAETEDVHLVLGREVTDLVEGGDLVSAVWRVWDTPTEVKNPHR